MYFLLDYIFFHSSKSPNVRAFPINSSPFNKHTLEHFSTRMDDVAGARAVGRWRGRGSLPPAGRRGSTGRWAGTRGAARAAAGGGQQGRGGGEDNLRNRRHFGGALSPIQGPSVKHGT
jgi:hypothetical protein